MLAWEVVTGHHWIADPNEIFPNGWGTVFNPASGSQIAIGENRCGSTDMFHIGVPLCNSCDKPVPANGVCDECCIIHEDLAKGKDNA